MRYVCLVHIDPAALAALSPEEGKRLTDRSIDYDWALRDEDRLVLAQPLQPPGTAATLRLRDGRLSRTDGPFAETKEFLGGFFIIDAEHLDEAAAIAGRSPMAAMGSIEVRPVLDQIHSETGRARPPLRL